MKSSQKNINFPCSTWCDSFGVWKNLKEISFSWIIALVCEWKRNQYSSSTEPGTPASQLASCSNSSNKNCNVRIVMNYWSRTRDENVRALLRSFEKCGSENIRKFHWNRIIIASALPKENIDFPKLIFLIFDKGRNISDFCLKLCHAFMKICCVVKFLMIEDWIPRLKYVSQPFLYFIQIPTKFHVSNVWLSASISELCYCSNVPRFIHFFPLCS